MRCRARVASAWTLLLVMVSPLPEFLTVWLPCLHGRLDYERKLWAPKPLRRFVFHMGFMKPVPWHLRHKMSPVPPHATQERGLPPRAPPFFLPSELLTRSCREAGRCRLWAGHCHRHCIVDGGSGPGTPPLGLLAGVADLESNSRLHPGPLADEALAATVPPAHVADLGWATQPVHQQGPDRRGHGQAHHGFLRVNK